MSCVCGMQHTALRDCMVTMGVHSRGGNHGTRLAPWHAFQGGYYKTVQQCSFRCSLVPAG